MHRPIEKSEQTRSGRKRRGRTRERGVKFLIETLRIERDRKIELSGHERGARSKGKVRLGRRTCGAFDQSQNLPQRIKVRRCPQRRNLRWTTTPSSNLLSLRNCRRHFFEQCFAFGRTGAIRGAISCAGLQERTRESIRASEAKERGRERPPASLQQSPRPQRRILTAIHRNASSLREPFGLT